MSGMGGEISLQRKLMIKINVFRLENLPELLPALLCKLLPVTLPSSIIVLLLVLNTSGKVMESCNDD